MVRWDLRLARALQLVSVSALALGRPGLLRLALARLELLQQA
jgi:hypothetical protein